MPVHARRLAVALLSVAMLVSLAVAPAATLGGAAPQALPGVSLVCRWRGLDMPVGLYGAGDGTDRVFVVEKGGVIRLAKAGVMQSEPFLDVSGKVSGGYEQGLLGLAFPPDFGTNGWFYVDYTDAEGDVVVARYTVSGDPDRAIDGSETVVLEIPHRDYPTHNGGQLAFGPDGYLYVGVGDGGGTGDPLGNAQRTSALLGKILRIDVEYGGPTYTVPPSNPFVGDVAYRPEIWDLGLRNPWRFSFDRATGQLYIGDVGQSAWEEIDVEDPGDGGRNYGWNKYEGAHPYPPNSVPQPTTGLTFPAFEYSHQSGGHSVTGGFVYRGSDHPALAGTYLFGDYEYGGVYGLSKPAATWEGARLFDTPYEITSFGEDDAGEVYMCEIDGAVYQLVDAAATRTVAVERLGGADRYSTAATAALDAFPSGAATAVVASGESFPDALSAAALAGALEAPLLLTAKNAVPQALSDALGPAGLDASDVVIVGGTPAVSAAVMTQLGNAGYATSRVWGADRYDTAAQVALRVAAVEGDAFPHRAVIARGDAFPDALAAAPLAYAGLGPTLLVSPNAVPQPTADAISSLELTSAVVAGSTAAVSGSIADGLGVPYERAWGPDRYATAAALASYGVSAGLVTRGFTGVASGVNFPDGLSGGVATGEHGGVLLLTDPSRLPEAAADALFEGAGGTTRVVAFGSSAAVSAAAFDQMRWQLP